VAGPLDQLPRERTQTRADFDQPLAGPGIDGIDDTRNDIGIVQKVLAEALARPVTVDRVPQAD
jgi:hypothetical protein